MYTNKQQNSKKFDINKTEKPAVTVDVLIFSIQDNDLQVLLIKRGIPPFKDMWAIPGGFVRTEESLESAAMRELLEETGVKNVYLEQLYTFGDPFRDPRTRVITVAYFALIPAESTKLQASTDASDAQWYSVKELPALAFDHKEIVKAGIERLRSKIGYSNIVYGLLPNEFRLSELQKVYEVILNQKVDKRNFRKKMLSLQLLESTGKREIDGAHRPAMLYRFKSRKTVIFD